jgi:hypothetical protein
LTPTFWSIVSITFFPDKQSIATETLRRGILEDSLRVPHQAIVEFIAAVTRPIRGHIILKRTDALREAEEFLKQFAVLYPNEAIVPRFAAVPHTS